MKSMKLLLSLALTSLAACAEMAPVSRDSGGVDASMPATDSGTRPDGSTTRPEGGTSSDRCSASDMNASSTVGCNGGFVSGTPAANTPGGACMGGGEANPMGSCPANHLCTAEAMMSGICLPLCRAGSTYVSTGGCPMGFRCFDLGMQALCFRDCDMTHPCPMGQMCDNEGSCVPPMMKAH